MSGPRYCIIPADALDDDRVSDLHLRVLSDFGRAADRNGWLQANQSLVAKRLGRSRETINRTIRDLVEWGYLRKKQRFSGKDGRQMINDYQVVMDRAERAESRAEEQPEVGIQPTPCDPDITGGVMSEDHTPCDLQTSHHKNDPLLQRPSSSPPGKESEREARARETEDRKIVERWLKRVHPSWPSFVSDSGDRALAAAMALTPDEREQAADRMADYLAVERQNKGRCAFAVYLAEKRWERLAPKEPEKPKPAYAPAFGPVWAARRARLLLGGPMVATPLKAWEERAIEAGTLSREAAETSARRNGGWPVVNAMHEAAAQRGNGYSNPDPVDERLGKLCEFVLVDCDCWRAWKAEHERLGWPWLPDPGTMRGAYFPAGGPERLGEFEAAVRGEDDAGGREAAE